MSEGDKEIAARVWVARMCEVNGYLDPVMIDARRYAFIIPFLFTHAIMTGVVGDYWGVDDRWCYSSYSAAKEALDAWQAVGFEGEPQGWHRHPRTGRRIEGGQPVTYM